MDSNFNPLISIVINCYNGEKYLEKSLESIKNQTYQNWEVIFWDVSTSDQCFKIFNKFQEKRFKYFNEGKKKNLYHSRNEAIEKTSGEILSFLDCDDWWLPDKLEKQIFYFKDNSISLVYSNYYEYNQKNKKIKKIPSRKILSGYICEKIISDYHIGILTTLIRKETFKKLGGYNNYFHIIGDFEFNIRLSQSYKIKGIKDCLAFYRVHNDNISQNLDQEIEELEHALEIFKNLKFKNLKRFKNYLNFKKCYAKLSKKNYFQALKFFNKINLGYLKIKILILFFLKL